MPRVINLFELYELYKYTIIIIFLYKLFYINIQLHQDNIRIRVYRSFNLELLYIYIYIIFSFESYSEFESNLSIFRIFEFISVTQF